MSQPEREDESRDKSRFRRWDVVILVLVFLFVLGLFLPSVQKISNGNRTKCLNNIRQIGLAAQAAHDMQRHLPPHFGIFNDKPFPKVVNGAHSPYSATVFYHLLPFIEQNGVYQRLPPLFDYPAAGQYVLAPKPPIVGLGDPDENAASISISTYICPIDTTGDPSGVNSLSLPPATVPPSKWGTNSYAANYLLFGLVESPRLPESVPDGLSMTILFTEKAPICADTATGKQGGNLWAVPAFFPADLNARFNYSGTFGYDPADANPTRPYRLALFQTQPDPGKCDPSLAQSPHKGGINVAMADGSCRFVASTISPKTWAAVLTPYPIKGLSPPKGDVPGDDWEQ
jgi:prepilin-type processing-associated H-X9-DG protein